MKKIRTFLRGVKKEMARVKWPEKKHMFKYSVSTILFIMIFGLFFYGIAKIAEALQNLV